MSSLFRLLLFIFALFIFSNAQIPDPPSSSSSSSSSSFSSSSSSSPNNYGLHRFKLRLNQNESENAHAKFVRSEVIKHFQGSAPPSNQTNKRDAIKNVINAFKALRDQNKNKKKFDAKGFEEISTPLEEILPPPFGELLDSDSDEPNTETQTEAQTEANHQAEEKAKLSQDERSTDKDESKRMKEKESAEEKSHKEKEAEFVESLKVLERIKSLNEKDLTFDHDPAAPKDGRVKVLPTERKQQNQNLFEKLIDELKDKKEDKSHGPFSGDDNKLNDDLHHSVDPNTGKETESEHKLTKHLTDMINNHDHLSNLNDLSHKSLAESRIRDPVTNDGKIDEGRPRPIDDDEEEAELDDSWYESSYELDDIDLEGYEGTDEHEDLRPDYHSFISPEPVDGFVHTFIGRADGKRDSVYISRETTISLLYDYLMKNVDFTPDDTLIMRPPMGFGQSDVQLSHYRDRENQVTLNDVNVQKEASFLVVPHVGLLGGGVGKTGRRGAKGGKGAAAALKKAKRKQGSRRLAQQKMVGRDGKVTKVALAAFERRSTKIILAGIKKASKAALGEDVPPTFIYQARDIEATPLTSKDQKALSNYLDKVEKYINTVLTDSHDNGGYASPKADNYPILEFPSKPTQFVWVRIDKDNDQVYAYVPVNAKVQYFSETTSSYGHPRALITNGHLFPYAVAKSKGLKEGFKKFIKGRNNSYLKMFPHAKNEEWFKSKDKAMSRIIDDGEPFDGKPDLERAFQKNGSHLDFEVSYINSSNNDDYVKI